MIPLTLACVSLCLTGFAEPTYEKLCQEGRKYLLAHKYDEAEKAYDKAIKADESKSLAYFGLALALSKRKQYSEVDKFAEMAIEKGDDDAPAFLLRGIAHHALGKLGLAEGNLDKAIQESEEFADAYAERGRVCLAMGNESQAMRDLSRAIELDRRNDHETYAARALLYFREGKYRDAARDYEQAANAQKESADYRFWRGQAYFCNREWDRAIKAASEAIKLKERYGAAYLLIGASHFQKNEFDKALAELKKATGNSPGDAGAFRWLGKTLLAVNEVEQAIENLEEAKRIDPSYAGAYRVLATAYQKANRPDDADDAREKLRKLRDKPRKTDALGVEPWEGAFPSQVAVKLPCDPTSVAAGMLTRQAASLSAKAKAAAESKRRELQPWKKDVDICEVASILPTACDDADDLYGESDEMLKAGDFEVAAVMFEKVQEQYQAALDAFEEAASKDHTLWLGWARHKAEGDLPRDQKAATWIVLAEASYLAGDREGYRRFADQAVSYVRARGITDPKAGVLTLLNIAQARIRCADRSGAKSSVLAAAELCDGIQDAWPKSFRLARCAGFLARLGESDEWTRRMQQALAAAGRMGRQNTPERAYQPPFVRCIAYAEAWSPEKAFSSADGLANAYRKPYGPKLAKWAAPAHASATLAAATAQDSRDSGGEAFSKGYAAACTHLATLLQVDAHDFVAVYAREQLVAADVRLGHCDRAWISVANIPDPKARGRAIARILHARISQGQIDSALTIAEHLSEGSDFAEALSLCAQARVQGRKETMVQLRKWAAECSGAAGQSAALAGIAVGLKARTAARASGGMPTEDRNTPALRETFDRDAAKAPEWWLGQASALACKIEAPRVRARMWLQLAYAYREANDQAGCRDSAAEAIRCTSAIWSQILDRRPHAQREYDGMFRWREDQRARRQEKAEIHAMLTMLMALESLQHEVGDRQEAFDTLLMALKCVEAMPRDGGYASPATPDALTTWLARIAGRARLRGRSDIARIILAGCPWSEVHAARGTDTFLSGLAAAEARDIGTLENLAEETRVRATTGSGRSDVADYAAHLYAKLALVAATKGDEQRYRQAATKVGGLISNSRAPASRAILLRLAEAAALLGETDIAQEYLDQSQVRGPDRDAVLAQIATRMFRDGRSAGAHKLLEQIQDKEAIIQVWFAAARVKASAPSAQLSAVFEGITALSSEAEKAATLAGTAMALPPK